MITTPEIERDTFKIDSLDNFQPLNNHLLIKPIIKNIDRKTKSGISIVAPSYAEQPNHIDRIGTIIKLPDKLYFNNKMRWTDITLPDRSRPITEKYGKYERKGYTKKIFVDENGSMGWETEMNLAIGDIVLFNYLDAINSPIVICNGEKYYLIKYYECYARKRGKKTTTNEKVHIDYEIDPLNGYIICERVMKESQSKYDHLSNKMIDNRYLIAKYISKPIKKYLGKNDFDDKITNIKEGDKLLKIDPALAPETEFIYHAEFFNEKKEYVFLQRRHFVAVMN